MAAAFNHASQQRSRQPIFKVLAIHSDAIAAKATPIEAGRLEPFLALSIGCKLMVLENIWTERGIVNGTQCRLYDVVWPDGSNPTKDEPDQPLCLLIAVPKRNYTGPSIEQFTWRTTDYAVIPLYRSQRDFYLSGQTRHRSQFPVCLAYALTIHKAQGMTMDKVALDLSIGKKDSILFYVACSRVKRIGDILFEQPFDHDRIRMQETFNATMRQEDWERRRLQRLLA
jgi:ATP-dependent DNA helicase PIF1